jgi:hypothetical protein
MGAWRPGLRAMGGTPALQRLFVVVAGGGGGLSEEAVLAHGRMTPRQTRIWAAVGLRGMRPPAQKPGSGCKPPGT